MTITITITQNGNHVGQIVAEPGRPPQKYGQLDWLNTNLAPRSARLGRPVSFEEDPAEWALSLPAAYPGYNLEVSVAGADAGPAAGPAAVSGETSTGTGSAPATSPHVAWPSQAADIGLPHPNAPVARVPAWTGPTGSGGPQAAWGGSGTPLPGYPASFATAAPSTREQAAAMLRLSGWWRRVAAVTLDGIICGAPVGVLSVLMLSGTSNSPNLRLLVELLAFVLTYAYYMLTMGRGGVRNGQSFGKQIMGIRVVRDDGLTISMGYVLFREFVCKTLIMYFTLGIYYLLDNLWPLGDSTRRALHDHLARTHVVFESVSAGDHQRNYAPYASGAVALPPRNTKAIVFAVIAAVIVGLLMLAIFVAIIVAVVHHVHYVVHTITINGSSSV